MEELTVAQRLARARERGLIKAVPEPTPEVPDTLADLAKTDHARDDVDVEIDGILNIGIDEAYRKWCGKSEPNLTGKRESIMVSCPKPDHLDKNPSAWLNLDKGTWFCGGCQEGGDGYDIAAYHFGYAVPGYKQGESFRKLRVDMAKSLGYRVKTTISGTSYVDNEPEARRDDTPAAPAQLEQDSDQQPSAQIIEFPLPQELQPLSIDWKSILPAETFLAQWMQATSEDDLPEEYYFWLGLMAVGLAAGDQAVLTDDPWIKGNLFVCLYGPSGIGKTRAASRLVRLLSKALPHDDQDPASTGTMLVPMPGSAEALIDAFSKPIFDPADPKKIIGYAGVRGLVRFDELSSLIARSNRVGSAIKPTLMEFFDSYTAVDIVSRGAGRVRAEHHFAASVASTQPGAIRDLLVQTDADSGFINRWVFASGPLKPLRSYRTTSIDIDHLKQPLNELRQWSSLRHHEIKLEGPALSVWTSFFQSTIEPIRVSSDKPLLTRIDLLLKKIILLFCINEKSDAPDAALVERAISLFPYLERSYNLLVGEIGVGPQQDCRTKILAAVETIQAKTGKGATVRQIHQRLGKRFAPDMIVRTIRAMEDLRDIQEVIQQGARGPKTVAYMLVGNDA